MNFLTISCPRMMQLSNFQPEVIVLFKKKKHPTWELKKIQEILPKFFSPKTKNQFTDVSAVLKILYLLPVSNYCDKNFRNYIKCTKFPVFFFIVEHPVYLDIDNRFRKEKFQFFPCQISYIFFSMDKPFCENKHAQLHIILFINNTYSGPRHISNV